MERKACRAEAAKATHVNEWEVMWSGILAADLAGYIVIEGEIDHLAAQFIATD
jgi:hypothetical protein